jgi:Virulence activator alpha C-term
LLRSITVNDFSLQAIPIDPLKDDLLVKLFAGDLVEPAVILAELEHHRAQHQDLLDACKSIERHVFNDVSKLALERRYRYLAVKQGISKLSGWNGVTKRSN